MTVISLDWRGTEGRAQDAGRAKCEIRTGRVSSPAGIKPSRQSREVAEREIRKESAQSSLTRVGAGGRPETCDVATIRAGQGRVHTDGRTPVSNQPGVTSPGGEQPGNRLSCGGMGRCLNGLDDGDAA